LEGVEAFVGFGIAPAFEEVTFGEDVLAGGGGFVEVGVDGDGKGGFLEGRLEALGFGSVIEGIDLVEEDGTDFTGFQVGEEGEEVFFTGLAEMAGRGDKEGFAVVTQQEVDAGDEGLNGRQVRAADDEAFAPVFPEFFGGEGNVVIGCIPAAVPPIGGAPAFSAMRLYRLRTALGRSVASTGMRLSAL